jgi:hypothetical protein
MPCMTPVSCERSPRKPRQNDGLPGSHVFEDTQDLHLEFLDLVALENSFTDGVLAGADVAQRVDCNLTGRERGHKLAAKMSETKKRKTLTITF